MTSSLSATGRNNLKPARKQRLFACFYRSPYDGEGGFVVRHEALVSVPVLDGVPDCGERITSVTTHYPFAIIGLANIAGNYYFAF